MNQLFEIQRILLEQFQLLPFFPRQVFEEISLDNRICGILGARAHIPHPLCR